MKFTRRIFLLGAIESEYGVDPGPNYQAILTNEGTEINPEATIARRNTVRPTFSPDGHVVGGKLWTMTVPVELKGGGMDDDSLVLPETDWALRACGLVREDGYVVEVDNISGNFQIGEMIENGGDEVGILIDFIMTGEDTGFLYIRGAENPIADNDTLTGAESEATADADDDASAAFVYKPTTERSEMTSVTVHYFLDKVRHVVTGVRGNLNLNLGVNSFGLMNFEFQGIWSEPTDEANPDVSYSRLQPPVVKSAGLNIGGWNLQGAAATAMQLNLGNQLSVRNDINAADGIAGVEITGREANGSVNPEVVELSTFNPWSKWRDGVRDRLYCQVGSNPGERMRILIPRAQYNNFTYQNRDGIATYELPFIATGESEAEGGSGGDDEVYYIFY